MLFYVANIVEINENKKVRNVFLKKWRLTASQSWLTPV